VPIPQNLLSANSESMETSAASWSALSNCTVAQDTTRGLDGTSSLKITSTAAGNATAICNTANQAYPLVTVGVRYSFSYGVYVTVAGLTANIVWDWYNGTTFLSTATGPVLPLTVNGWTMLELPAVAPASSTLARIYPVFTATAASQVADIDSIYFGPARIPAAQLRGRRSVTPHTRHLAVYGR
jgi:hypothetical protein